MEKKNVLKLYNLPEKVEFCKKCTISNQRPRIKFDNQGICSACHYADTKKNIIDWKKREEELMKLCDRHRKKDGSFDVVVPCSGGKDGAWVAHQLKYKYGMNPLTVTWAPLSYTKIGRQNLSSFIDSGFDHILGTPNPTVTRKFTELSLKVLGDPFQPFIYGQFNFPISIAVKYKIRLIMYGEDAELEYGGDTKRATGATRTLKDANWRHFSGITPEDFEKYGMSKKDLKFFSGPNLDSYEKEQTEIHWFGYYRYWDPQENFYYCSENTGFKPNEERNEGTYSKYASIDDEFDGFHYYFSFIKFGIGRATSDSAHEIRDGKITREEGIALVRKYDGEFPKKYYKKFLNYCSIGEEDFTKIVDSWRSDHIWYKNNKGEWKLKNQI